MVSAFLSSLSPWSLGECSCPLCVPGGGAGFRHWARSGRGAEPSCGEATGLGLASSHGEVRDPRAPRRAGVGAQGWAGCVGREQGGEDRRK